MGKASRRKKDDKPDHQARVRAGLCLHCGKRPPIRVTYPRRATFVTVWCRPCTDHGQAVRRARTEPMPTPTVAQWQALHDALDPDQP